MVKPRFFDFFVVVVTPLRSNWRERHIKESECRHPTGKKIADIQPIKLFFLINKELFYVINKIKDIHV